MSLAKEFGSDFVHSHSSKRLIVETAGMRLPTGPNCCVQDPLYRSQAATSDVSHIYRAVIRGRHRIRTSILAERTVIKIAHDGLLCWPLKRWTRHCERSHAIAMKTFCAASELRHARHNAAIGLRAGVRRSQRLHREPCVRRHADRQCGTNREKTATASEIRGESARTNTMKKRRR